MASEAARLAPGVGVDGDDEVYPRPLSASSGKQRNKKGMAPELAVRYSTGGSRDKTWNRYSNTMRSIVGGGEWNGLRGGAKIDNAGILSFVTYHWVFEYLWQAFRGTLSSSQEWSCSVYDASDVNIARMEVLWEEEKVKAAAVPRPPSLFRAVFAFTKTRLWTACAVFLFCLVFGFIGPTCFVRGIVSYVENPSGDSHYGVAIALVLGLLFVEVARVMSYGATWAISYRTGIRLRGALLGLLFKRAVGLKTLGKKTPAEIVNIFANDGQRIFDAITFAPLVLVGPLVLIGGIVYLVIVIGPWSFIGIFVFFLFDAVQYYLGKTMVRCRAAAIEKTEKRMKLMGEILGCIRAIKMNAWEKSFIDRVQTLRNDEKRSLRAAGYAQSLAIACGPVVPVVAAILTFLGVVLSGGDLLASDAFSAITVFFVMLFGIRMIPYGSRYLAEAAVALRRIQELLDEDQWEGLAPAPTDPAVALKVRNASFTWTKTQAAAASTTADESTPADVSRPFSLQEINLIVQKKELIGVCGAVGAGKSALLSAIAGNLCPLEGEVEVAGQAVLVPQVSWIQNATVRDNILFGQQMNSKRYHKAITAAQLLKDLETMPANDLTEIGERGATLSGGQKARIALARALYSQSEVLLIDDVIAACDNKVAEKIFEEAVLDLCKGRTVLLVTNDINRLCRCDRVVLLRDGRVLVSGGHSELLENSPSYLEYCNTTTHNITVDTADSVLVSAPPSEALPRRDRAASPTDEDYEHLDETNPVVETEKIELVGIEKAEQKSKKAGELTEEEEDHGTAAVPCSVYSAYMRASGGALLWTVLIAAFLINVAASIFSPFWLARWLKMGHDEHVVDVDGEQRLEYSNVSLAASPDTPFYASVYGISLLVLFFSGIFKALVFVKVSLTAATRLHNGMLSAIVGASANFFDATPTGRILNRFSRDVDEIDVKLPFTSEVFLQNMLTCVGFLGVIAWVLPLFLLISIPLFALFALFVLCFRAGIRCMKRSENISRSPLFSHVTTSLEGLQVIHSHGQQVRFMDTLKERLDSNSASMFVFQSAMRWLAVWLDLLVVGITVIVALLIVLLTGSVSPADAGMALAFAIQMSGIFQFAVRTQTELEAKMTSVERVIHYTKAVQPDGPQETRRGTDVPADWPARGQIDFVNVCLRYQPSLPLALNDVSFTVNAGEKVAIIGRTGSGKSSLGSALFRLHPATAGKICIDGVDTATIGLHRLRKSMAVIPQDPVLFAGTLRYNLDPLGAYADHQLWTALEKAHISSMVSELPQKLEAAVTAGGENFSVGERQLLCMARALLIKAKVVLLDEATASLDAATDRQIWHCITTAFENATVLVIAHRLQHVHLMNRIMMMDAGRLIDFDEPTSILRSCTASTAEEKKEEQAEAEAESVEGALPEDAKKEKTPEESEDSSDVELVSEAKLESIHDEDIEEEESK